MKLHGPMGAGPALDNPMFMVALIYHYHRHFADSGFVQTALPALRRALDFVPITVSVWRKRLTTVMTPLSTKARFATCRRLNIGNACSSLFPRTRTRTEATGARHRAG